MAEGNAAVSQEALDEFGRRVQEGDPVATAVFADAGHAMTSMLTSVINLADLDTVIIGGSWSRVPADVLARMAARIQERILSRGTLNVRLASRARRCSAPRRPDCAISSTTRCATSDERARTPSQYAVRIVAVSRCGATLSCGVPARAAQVKGRRQIAKVMLCAVL